MQNKILRLQIVHQQNSKKKYRYVSKTMFQVGKCEVFSVLFSFHKQNRKYLFKIMKKHIINTINIISQ